MSADKKVNSSLDEYIRRIDRAGRTHDMNRFVLSGFHIWPLLRSQTISMFRNPEGYFAETKLKEWPVLSFTDKIRARLLARKAFKTFRQQLAQEFSGTSCRVLLYSKEATHTDRVNGKLYDRFTDPFFEKLQTDFLVLKIQLTKKNTVSDPYAIQPKLISQESFREYFYHSSRLGKMNDRIDQSLIEELAKLTDLPFAVRHVQSVFAEIVYYRALFREVFKLMRPEYVFLKCYYETDSAGLVLAAREAGIKTVDIQHGKQGIIHPMYTHWSTIPEKGYELLPDFFWNWGEESKSNIEVHLNRKQIHVPVTGGNLWMAKWKNEDFYQPDPQEKEFVSSLKQFTKVILFTLQPLDQQEIVPEYLAEAIRQSPADWIWLLRKHPFQKLDQNELLRTIGKTAARVEMEFASSLPLYFLLRQVHHHLTLWSSTGFEASDFDVPTIIAHDFGKKLYEKQLTDHVFSFAVNAAEILELIRLGKSNSRTPYIETEPAIADAAFRAIGLKG